ncbi:MAG: DHH family phosphoesterase [Candidatus Omnitrophota bacterium]
MMEFEKAKKKVSEARSIAISGHINPDGDSIGSLLALGLALKKLGKKVYMVSADGVPRPYRNLPGATRIRKKVPFPVDLAITVDCSNKEILGDTYAMFRKSRDVLEIDHHEFRRPFGTIQILDHKAAAVGELIYLLLKKLRIGIDARIGQNLLTSLVVETNSFRLPNVRAFTFRMCADLMQRGVDFYKLVDMVYWSKSNESAILTGICLSRCVFLKRGRLAWSIVKRRDFRKVGGKDEDVDAAADEIRSIKGVKIAVLFREKNKKLLRVSLRSKDNLNVASIAETFGGGGHFDVAGCSIPNSKKAISKLLSLAKKSL